MSSVTVELRNIAGTEAALGWAGAHTIVVALKAAPAVTALASMEPSFWHLPSAAAHHAADHDRRVRSRGRASLEQYANKEPAATFVAAG